MTLSMERIEKNRSGTWDCYAGALGQQIGTFKTKKAARDALDDWHYFHPEERQAQRESLVHHVIQIIREAHENGDIESGFDLVMRRYGGHQPEVAQ